MTLFGLDIDDDFPWEKWVDRFVSGGIYLDELSEFWDYVEVSY